MKTLFKKIMMTLVLSCSAASLVLAVTPDQYREYATGARENARLCTAGDGNLVDDDAQRQAVVAALDAIHNGEPEDAGLTAEQQAFIERLRRLAAVARDAFAADQPKNAASVSMAAVTEAAALLAPGLIESASKSIRAGAGAARAGAGAAKEYVRTSRPGRAAVAAKEYVRTSRPGRAAGAAAGAAAGFVCDHAVDVAAAVLALAATLAMTAAANATCSSTMHSACDGSARDGAVTVMALWAGFRWAILKITGR